MLIKRISGDLFFVIAITLTAVLCSSCVQSEMTKEKAEHLIGSAGGISKINLEASAIFQRYGTMELGGLSLFRPEITNYPAIAVLLSNSVPKSFLIVPETPGEPPQISILYGPHSRLKCIRIFQTTNGLSLKYRSAPSFEIASNIFLSPIAK